MRHGDLARPLRRACRAFGEESRPAGLQEDLHALHPILGHHDARAAGTDRADDAGGSDTLAHPHVDALGSDRVASTEQGSPGINLRREKLDPLIRELAAGTPGVELLLGHTVRELLREGERYPVCGRATPTDTRSICVPGWWSAPTVATRASRSCRGCARATCPTRASPTVATTKDPHTRARPPRRVDDGSQHGRRVSHRRRAHVLRGDAHQAAPARIPRRPAGGAREDGLGGSRRLRRSSPRASPSPCRARST